MQKSKVLNKHSKGSWKYEIEEGNMRYRIHNGDKIIAERVTDNSDVYDPYEAEANAKLIAAAPAMLKALESIKFLLECDIEDYKKGLCTTDKYAEVRLRDVIMPAIRKAQSHKYLYNVTLNKYTKSKAKM